LTEIHATTPEEINEWDIFGPLSSASDMWDIARAGDQLKKIEGWSKSKNPAVVTWAWRYLHATPALPDVQYAMDHSGNPYEGLPSHMNERPGTDLHVDWPITFMFHRCNDFFGETPTWEEFWEWLIHRERGDWVDPMFAKARDQGLSRGNSGNAIKYRAATAWQSGVREAWTLARFGQLGIWWKFHPLADIELKIDGWIEDHLMAIYVKSPYMDRKEQPEYIFGPSFTVHRFPLWKPGVPGVWVPDDPEIERVAILLQPVIDKIRGV
jgi:hypothetical protein